MNMVMKDIFGSYLYGTNKDKIASALAHICLTYEFKKI